MSHVSLPDRRGEQLVVGIQFIDGEADVELGPHLRGYFVAIGATITDEQPERVPAVDWKKADLLAYAAEHDIEVPNGTKAEILEAIHDGPASAVE